MRCPKCGYISFDHIDSCLRCNKDISDASKVEGTTYNVAPPAFLKFTKRDHSEEEKNEISFDNNDDDFGVVDPDLDVLVDDDEREEGSISFDDDLDEFDAFGEEESFEAAPAVEDDGEDDELDLGQFEDAFEDEDQNRADEDLSIEIPEELSDISDLSAPAEKRSASAPAAPAAQEEQDEFGDFNLDLDMDDLNDDFNLTANEGGVEETPEEDEDALADLSLDDLGLSEAEDDEPEAPEPPEKAKKEETDMDADLNFDLDLGGISLDDED